MKPLQDRSERFRRSMSAPFLIFLLLFASMFILFAPAPQKAGAAGGDAPFSREMTWKTIIIDNYAPYTFVNAQGEPDGFSVDLMKAVAKTMDVKLEITVDTWDNARHALESGAIDFLPMMAYSEERDKLYDFSPPHTIAFDAFFTRKDAPRAAIKSMDDLRGKTIIVMDGDQAHDYLLSLTSIETKLILVKSLPDALRKLAAGEGDAALMPKLVGLTLVRDLNLANLETSPVVVEAYNRPFSFAVKEGNQEALERLTQGMNIVKETGEYEKIYEKWFGTLEPRGISTETFLRDLGWVILAFALVWGVLLLWSLSLRRQVAARTRSLQTEVVERERAEEDYRIIFERAPVGIFRSTVDGRFLKVNRAMAEMYGYSSPGEMLDDIKSIATQMYTDPTLRREFSRMLAERGEVSNFESQDRRKDGSVFWTSMNARMVKNDAGGILYYEGFVVDITERKQAEEALRASEARLQVIFEHANDAMHIDNADDEIIEVNSRMCEMLGYSREELLKMKIADLQAPEFRMNGNIIQTEMEKHGNSLFEGLDMHRDGRRIPVEISVSHIESPQGDLYVSILRDITERKQAEEALRESEEKFQKAFYASPVIMSISSLEDGTFIDANDQFFKITELTPEQVIGRKSFEIKLWSEEQRLAIIKEIQQQGFVHGKEVELTTASGKVVPLLWYGDMVQIGGKRCLIVSGYDLAERKQAEEALKESEANLSALIENTDGSIWAVDVHYGLIVGNEEFHRNTSLALGRRFVRGESVLSPSFPAKVNAEWQGYYDRALRGESFTVETTTRFRAEPRRVEHHFSPMRTAAGEVHGATVYERDITERKQADENLRQMNERFILASRAANFGVWDWDIQKNHLAWDEQMYELYGVKKEDFSGAYEAWLNGLHPDDVARSNLESEQARRGEKEYDTEFRVMWPDGSIHHLKAYGQVIRDENGNALRMTGVNFDITERKQTEVALQKSEERYRLLFSGMTEGFALHELIFDENGEPCDYRFLEVNPAFERLTGLKREDLIGRGQKEVLPAEDPFWFKTYSNVAQTGTSVQLEHYSPPLQKYYEVYAYCPAPNQFAVIFKDITARKQAEEALMENEERWRRAIADSPIPIMIHDEDDHVLQISSGWTRFSGYVIEDIPTLSDWTERAYGERTGSRKDYIDQLFSIDKTVNNGEWEVTAKNGSKRIWAFQTTPLGKMHRGKRVLHSMAIDITERKRAEEEVDELNKNLEERVKERTAQLEEAQEQLVRNEKLAVLGQMAGSVGHELRNPLAVISNAIYFLKMAQGDASEKVKEYLSLIEKQVHVSNKIIGDLLDFTRIKSAEREPITVSQIIRQTVERFPAPGSVRVILDLPEDLPQVYADPQHIMQVFGNIVLNAYQAMSRGGQLSISAAVRDDQVWIATRDTGVGISPENMKKLFEPLFTTKAKGIGLGLAVSQKLIEANGGSIVVQSEVGTGSTFTLCLPSYRSAS
jgi:PAS domain S-box-containing protein